MAKQIVYSEQARASIRKGIDAVANAVKSTLGPNGHTVIIDDGDGFNGPNITKDGVTVAKHIELSDNLQNVGAKLIKKVSAKTADDAGDGTTSATVIAQALIDAGQKRIESGVNPMKLKRGIDQAARMAVEFLKDNSVEVEDADDLRNIATISANGDEEIGLIISDAINEIGQDGVITVETSKSIDTYIETVKGLRYDRGFISNYFITNPENQECVLENPYILMTEERITSIKQIQKVLEGAAIAKRPIFIISDGVEGEALTMLVVNRMRGTISVCATKCPSFGDRKKAELADIATITGGEVIDPALGINLEDATIDNCGQCDRIICTAKHTTIVGGKGDAEQISERTSTLCKLISEEKSEYNKKNLQERLAKIEGGVAILYVGAISETELSEKKDRIDDAICATKAANEEGFVAGGGTAYLNASKYLSENTPELQADELVGYNLVVEALKSPIIQIADNSLGEGEGKIILSTVLSKKMDNITMDSSFNYGYNAATGEFGDMIKMKVIDPTKVCRTAIENACSIIGMYLMTNCIIFEEPKKKEVEE